MQPRKWLVMTSSIVLITSLVIIASNRVVDIYGLYQPTRGRGLPAFGDPRIAKYLLSTHYVPENFNAVLAGSSMSANWDLTAVQRLRIYNESLDAGNIVEEKALIEAALLRPGIIDRCINNAIVSAKKGEAPTA